MHADFMPVNEVAKLLRVSRPKAAALLKQGAVPGLKKHHGVRRVLRRVFEEWHAKQRQD